MSSTLVFGHSHDATLDLVVNRLPPNSIFRLNIDLLEQYELEIQPEFFHISDPSGRRASLDDVSKSWWRKPSEDDTTLLAMTPLDVYAYREARYLLLDLHGVLRRNGRAVLTDPSREQALGKLQQLAIARKYFPVPGSRIQCSRSPITVGTGLVVKSLTGSIFDGDRVFWTQPLEGGSVLEASRLWFTQEHVSASHDVTVTAVGRQLFAFASERARLMGLDWRAEFAEDTWSPFELNTEAQFAIRAFLDEADLQFARLDFLLTDESKLVFLEVNTNGQWAWLDFKGEHGLLQAMCEELNPLTPSRARLSH